MEKKRYSVEHINELKRKNKVTFVIMFSLLGISIITAVATAFFINDSTATFLSVLYSTMFSLSFCVLIYCSYNIIGQNNGMIKHIQKIIYQKPLEIEGTITSISEAIVINKYIKAQKIEINSNEDVLTVYYEQALGYVLNESISYRFVISNNFILSVSEVER